MKDVEAQLIHDMQNTAMVLRGAAAELHGGRGQLTPAAVDHLTEMLARRSEMLVHLLGDLSTSHLAERGELDLSLQRVPLADVCGEVLDDIGRDGGSITVDVPDDAVVIADRLRVTQVLDNLLTNALRYGGPNILVSAVLDGASVRLCVSDDGPGIPEGLRSTLFDAYVQGTTSSGLGGSGLGLSIVRQLCEVMGGTIEYLPVDGTRFTATLPAIPVASEPIAVDVAPAGHAVAFWTGDPQALTEHMVAYAANGLASGEAVLVAATTEHHKMVEEGLQAIGIDPHLAIRRRQYFRLDAEELHADLPNNRHIDRDRFEAMIGQTVEQVRSRWAGIRVFGEIVDLYWRRHDDHLALELEDCWNKLRARVPFPLLCGYELAPGESADSICGCHDVVVDAAAA